jgi:hypothetical protein
VWGQFADAATAIASNPAQPTACVARMIQPVLMGFLPLSAGKFRLIRM